MSNTPTRPRQPQPALSATNKPSPWPFRLVAISLLPVFAAIVFYHYESFDPGELPIHEISGPSVAAPRVNSCALDGSERLGEGRLPGPEDIAYDPESGVIYTGCNDGWVKRVRLNDSVVVDWVNTGGRPAGLVLDRQGVLIVADTEKGLLRVSRSGEVELLTDEAEGVKFGLTNGVDVAEDGTIYFTDASYKYSLNEFMFDILFMTFDPKAGRTKVLVRDIYFANGVAVSPNQDFVVFCETVLARCLRYYITGEKSGTVDKFIDRLPGVPDNICYDGEGKYWIALSTEFSGQWQQALKYPWIRKGLAILEKYSKLPHMERNSGVFVVDLEGNPVAHYHDPRWRFLSAAVKIGSYLHCGSIADSFITRLDLTRFGAA